MVRHTCPKFGLHTVIYPISRQFFSSKKSLHLHFIVNQNDIGFQFCLTYLLFLPCITLGSIFSYHQYGFDSFKGNYFCIIFSIFFFFCKIFVFCSFGWWRRLPACCSWIVFVRFLVFNSLQLTWFDCLCQYFQRLFCHICEIWPSQYLWQVRIFLNSLPRWQLFKFLGFLCVFCAHYFRLLDVSRQFSIVVGGPSLLLVDSDSDAVMGDFGLTRQLETKNHLQMHQISGQEIHLS